MPIDRLRDIVNNDNVFNNIKEVIVEAEHTRTKRI